MDDLTKSQKKVLISMYELMLNRQPALPEKEANFFGSADQVNSDCELGYSHEEISDICIALAGKGYITGDYGDDTLDLISLSDGTIVYMENKFKNNMKSLISFLAELV